MKLSFPLFGRPRPGGRPLHFPGAGAVEWLVVGLGNPGARYAGNRHNVGFQVADRLAADAAVRFDERRNQALLARGVVEGVRIALVKPQTYMNLSGRAVSGVVRFYKVPVACVLAVYDDLDLPLGALRLREQGGAGGHRGIASLIDELGSQDFPRVRIGIGRPAGSMPPEAYVLQDFDADQRAVMLPTYERAVDAVRTTLREGFQTAMNRFN
jgi:PTH1 family peptidyl-tRNA hydrolase